MKLSLLQRSMRNALLFFCLNAYLSANGLSWDHRARTITLTPDKATAEIVFRADNLSESIIEIDHVETSCGCTISQVTNKQIAPGQSTEIIAKFEKKARKQSGEIQLRVFIKGQTTASDTLNIQVEIHRAIQIKPAIIYWRAGDQALTRSVEILLDPRYAQGIESIEYDQQQFKLLTQPSSEQQNVLTLHVTPIGPKRAVQASIQVHTRNAPGYPSERAVFHAFVRP